MKLHPKLRSAYKCWSAWAQANKCKLLIDMPLWYLITMAALPGLAAALAASPLAEATRVYIDQILPVAPGSFSAVVGLWLLAWWAFLGAATVTATTHGRALGERLFNSPSPAA